MSERVNNLREKIDDVDQQIVQLLDERARHVKEIGKIKQKEGMDLYVPGREREILKRFESMEPKDFPISSVKHIYREIIATCLNLEKPLKIAYLGPEATFTHLAGLKQFGRETELVPHGTVSDVFNRVERDEVDFGIVPVESSNDGAVKHTLDRFLNSTVSICSEIYLRINLYLLSREDSIGDVETVYSHSQALSQARDWIETNLADVEIKETQSTAEAARLVSNEKGTAAVASEVASDIYDLNILASKLEDRPDNFTRFLVLGTQIPKSTGDDKTSIVFSVEDRPGALYEVLEIFGENEINMTKIESRPSMDSTWNHVLFVDFLGHQADPLIESLLADLQDRTPFSKILGSYPRQEPFE